MAKGGIRPCRVCCIIIVVLFVLILGAGAFLALYVPNAEKMSEKLVSDTISVVYYSEDKTEYSTNIKNILSFINENFETEYNVKEVIEFSSATLAPDDEDYVEGYVFFLDSIGSSYKLFKDYVTYIRNTSSDDASALSLHFSPRGKALFVGNITAEIEFRKIIF